MTFNITIQYYVCAARNVSVLEKVCHFFVDTLSSLFTAFLSTRCLNRYIFLTPVFYLSGLVCSILEKSHTVFYYTCFTPLSVRDKKDIFCE